MTGERLELDGRTVFEAAPRGARLHVQRREVTDPIGAWAGRAEAAPPERVRAGGAPIVPTWALLGELADAEALAGESLTVLLGRSLFGGFAMNRDYALVVRDVAPGSEHVELVPDVRIPVSFPAARRVVIVREPPRGREEPDDSLRASRVADAVVAAWWLDGGGALLGVSEGGEPSRVWDEERRVTVYTRDQGVVTWRPVAPDALARREADPELRALGRDAAVAVLEGWAGLYLVLDVGRAQDAFREGDLDHDGELDFATSLEELRTAKLLEPPIAFGRRRGYAFQVQGDGDRWIGIARPLEAAAGGRTLYVGPAGEVHASAEPLEPGPGLAIPAGAEPVR